MSQVISYIICKVFENTIIDENCFDHSTKIYWGDTFPSSLLRAYLVFTNIR